MCIRDSLYVALREWADKHVDECNEIQDAKERYKYIVQLISANLNTYKTYQPNEEAVLSAWAVSYTHLDVYKRQASNISCCAFPWT